MTPKAELQTTPPSAALLPRLIYWACIVIALIWIFVNVSMAARALSYDTLNDVLGYHLSFKKLVPFAILLALVLRSGAVIWVMGLYIISVVTRLTFFQLDFITPSDAFFFLFRYGFVAFYAPMLVYLVYAKQVRRP